MELARALLWALILGYSWTGTQIRMYDDSDATGGHTAGQPHSAAEMAASTDPNVAANWVAYTSLAKMYRGLATVLVGSSTGGTATTTWTDRDSTFSFDTGFSVSPVGTNDIFNWGIKLGMGATASGRNGVTYLAQNISLVQTWNAYDCKFVSSGVNNFITVTASTASEFAGCTFAVMGTGINANVRWGSGSGTGSFYNCNVWGNSTAATGSVLSSFNVTNATGIYAGLNAANSFLRLTGATTLAVKDIILNGTPATSDIAFATAFGSGDLVRPHWSGATRISGPVSIPAGNLRESWGYDVLVTDASGNGVSGITVKLTDAVGNVQVNTTTDASGRISFGSGITMNMVVVRDHILAASVYTVRNRYPFLAEINGATLRYYHTWPVDGSGNFEDMVDAIPLAYASGGPTTWTEMSL